MQKRSEIFELNADCVRLCDELKACLEEERSALITLQTDGIVQCNFKKENLGVQLSGRRKQLRIALLKGFGTEDRVEVAAALPLADGEAWIRETSAYISGWTAVHALCEQNQKFIQHSLKNIGQIVDNLKRLFGDNSLYSAAGKRVESQAPGKVVEGRY